MRLILLSLLCASVLPAQLGGILNRAKSKVDAAKQKAAPVTDRAQKAVDTFKPWSEAEEQEIGEAAAMKMVAMFGLVDNPKQTRYVNLVGQAVAQFASRQVPYRFAILDTEIVNAFALPGGYIFITRAALASMSNEAQLAGALAHEIVHVSERHLETEIRSRRTSTWTVEEAKTTSDPGRFLASHKGDALLNDLFNMKLSREKEDGADERGSLLAAKAGYASLGLLEFLQTMSEINKRSENARAFGQLLTTHPPFDERAEKLQGVVERSGASGKTLSARFRQYVAK